QREERDQRLLGRARTQERPGQARHAFGHEQGAGARGLGRGAVTVVDQERDLLGSRGVERRNPADTPAWVALERGAEGHGKLTEREPGGLLHQGVFFGACESYARMISSVRSASADA